MPAGPASERRESARTAVVWDGLSDVLDGSTLDVVDIGGGTGVSAVRVAELGHRVTVVDPSPDALAALARRAREVGVEVVGQQGDLTSLPDLVAPGSADLVLCHGVLEVVDDPAAALDSIRECSVPVALSRCWSRNGTLPSSHAPWPATSRRRWSSSTAAPTGQPGRTGHRFTPDEATTLVAAAGFELSSVHGVRVFADLVPGSLLDLEPGATAALLELERAVSGRAEYLPLATQLHLVATTAG